MKRNYLIPVLWLLFTVSAHASLKVIASGESRQLDPSGIPPEMKSAYQLMQTKCIKCHSMERVVIALQTGIAPISGLEFNKHAAKVYGSKMMHKPDANISKQQVKTIVDLLCYLIDESAK
jgi:hypothetical protein